MKPAVQTHLNFSPSLKHSASFLHGSSPHGLTAEDKHENRFLKTGYFNLSTKQQQKKKKNDKNKKNKQDFLVKLTYFQNKFFLYIQVCIYRSILHLCSGTPRHFYTESVHTDLLNSKKKYIMLAMRELSIIFLFHL